MARFFKAHALGNDYLALEAAALPFPLSPPAVRLLCDRHRGVGSDGILALVPSGKADFGLRIFNPDGTEAEKSGNGLRIFGVYLRACGYTQRDRLRVETPAGVVEIALLGADAAGVWQVEVEMGRASFRSAAVGLRGPDRDSTHEALELAAGARVDATAVSLGNPHCVVFQDDTLEPESLREIAPRLCAHPAFERGANVQFARVAGPAALEAWVWERGAGETLASGSSACAVAAAAVRRGLVAERQLEVRMPGGTLGVEVRDDWSLLLRGPVEVVYRGELDAGLLERLRPPRPPAGTA